MTQKNNTKWYCLFLLSALALTGWSMRIGKQNTPQERIEGSHVMVTVDHSAILDKTIQRVIIGSMINVTIERGNTPSLIIETSDNIQPYVMTSVNGDTLTITMDPTISYNVKKLQARLTLPNLTYIENAGSGDITTRGTISCADFTVKLMGIGNITMDALSAKTLAVALCGTGTILIKSGSATVQTVDICGTGSFDGSKVSGKTGNVTITGVGSAYMNTTTLHQNICGVGSVRNAAQQ